MSATETVTVDLGARSYDIVIGDGVLPSAGKRIAEIVPGARCAIVTDETVAAKHLKALTTSLDAARLDHIEIIVAPGEPTKSYAHLQTVVETILAGRLERNDVVIGFGGGVIGDLTGFAASIVRRGMNFVQVPTTLLAQVDSSVGGKTGINAPQGKNLVGTFYQPRLVLADTSLLDTLSEREFKAGYAEVVKYGLINDAAFFSWLESNWRDVFAGGEARIHAVAHSCSAKAGVVARDERESGERALLNLGHTFGHALEGIARYNPDVLVHGEGVSIGMTMAHAFSARLNHASPDDTARVRAHLEAVGLPTDLSPMRAHIDGVEQLMDFIAQDKKVSRGALTFILTRGIGEAFVAKDVPASEVRLFLNTLL
ncbi:MAG: 3-dehydroquinate synthase [Pseudomonadota bacterium]